MELTDQTQSSLTGSITPVELDEPTLQLSVVTALYNCLNLTKLFLESLEKTLPAGLSYEVILIDDLSTDGTREFLAQLSAPYRIVLNKEKGNYAVNNNHGALLARGRIIAFLNNDLVLKPNWFEPMAKLLKQFPEAGAIGNIHINPKTQMIDHTGIAFGPKGETFHRFKNRKSFPRGDYLSINAVSSACLLMTRERFLEIGGFDESYVNGSEDVDLCIRLRLSGYEIYASHESRIFHHVSSSPGRFHHTNANHERLAKKWTPVMVKWSQHEWPEAYLSRYARHFWKMRPKMAIKALISVLRQQ